MSCSTIRIFDYNLEDVDNLRFVIKNMLKDLQIFEESTLKDIAEGSREHMLSRDTANMLLRHNVFKAYSSG